ncbi:MAG: PorV/PorQ family protein [Ignavibacteriales bacterium]|nr:PorV/PorQ family protein [Ignavibacteriales bacterium]
MVSIIRKFVFIFVMVVVFISNTIAGRADKAGTAAASELLIPVGARLIGLSGASLANVYGMEAIYLNPAGLSALASQHGVMFSHMMYIADIDIEYFAAATKLTSIGCVGFSLKSLNVGDIQITTEDQPDGTGEITSPTFLVIGGTFSRQISDHISVGFSANYIYEKMASVSASGIAFNLGVQYNGIGGIDGLSVGATVKNIGSSIKFDGPGMLREARISDVLNPTSTVKIEAAASDLPSTIEIGLGYIASVHEMGNILIASTFQNNNYSADEYKFGAEYIYKNIFSLRSGITISPSSGAGEYIFGQSLGVGVNYMTTYAKISFDYSYRVVRYFDGNHVFGIILEI